MNVGGGFREGRKDLRLTRAIPGYRLFKKAGQQDRGKHGG